MLRNAFAETMTDPRFLEEARTAHIEISPQSGDSVQRTVEQLYAAPRDILNRIKAIQEP